MRVGSGYLQEDDTGLVMAKSDSELLTDLYQLNMMAAYLEHGLTEAAVFELFVRKLPFCRGFLMTAGLEQALPLLDTVSFTAEDIDKRRCRDCLEFRSGRRQTAPRATAPSPAGSARPEM
jgi:nicotinic acid phosphoribosyltransferase